MQPSRWQQWAPWSIQSLAEEMKRLSVYCLSFSSSLEDREYLELCSRRNTITYNIISIDRIPSLQQFWKRGVSSGLTWVEWRRTPDPERQRHSCEGCWLLGDLSACFPSLSPISCSPISHLNSLSLGCSSQKLLICQTPRKDFILEGLNPCYSMK